MTVRSTRRRLLAGAPFAGAAILGGGHALAQDENDMQVDPKVIWQAGLERLQGTYKYVQVASPGGLWETFHAPGTAPVRRQVSINEIPAELRAKLEKAEITISDLKLPSRIQATQRESPSKRGMLRFYDETTTGRLVMRGLPGIGADSDDTGEFSGPVQFVIHHSSHSNPSPTGVFQQRTNQEPTWGAATLDFADLNAIPLVRQDGGQPPEDDEETHGVIGNARVLRFGAEIFAFVQWQSEADGRRSISGAVRLLRKEILDRRDAPPPNGAPGGPPVPAIPPGYRPPASDT